jgi:integrase
MDGMVKDYQKDKARLNQRLLSHCWHIWKRADLRHTFGSLLIQADVSPAYVQKQIGHGSIQVAIDVYSHLIPGNWKKIFQVLRNRYGLDTKESGSDKLAARALGAWHR